MLIRYKEDEFSRLLREDHALDFLANWCATCLADCKMRNPLAENITIVALERSQFL